MDKLPPLDQGDPEMKCPYLHHNCWEKNSIKLYVACHGYLKNHQSYIEKLPKKSDKITLFYPFYGTSLKGRRILNSEVKFNAILALVYFRYAWKQAFCLSTGDFTSVMGPLQK